MLYPLKIVDGRIYADVSDRDQPERLLEVALVLGPDGTVTWDYVRDEPARRAHILPVDPPA